MPHTRIATPFLVFVLTLPLATAVAAQTLTADEKELSTYRLTMPTLKKVMAALEGFMEEMSKDPKFQEQQKLKAQIEALQQKDELTEAQQAELDKLQERAEKLEEEIDRMQESSGMTNPKTIAEMEASIKKFPPMMRALSAQGVTPKEYSLTMMALLQASLAEGLSQGKADLKNLPPGVNPENVKFVRENKDALAAMQASLKKPGR